MNIIRTRCKKTFAGPGMWAYDAEAKVEDRGEILYIHQNFYGNDHFTVAEESIFDYMTGETEEEVIADFIEEYENLDEAQESRYIEIFKMLDQMIRELD